jgi:ABC-type transport system involved in multi-copper enzyme maturation permease subunit
MVHLVAIVGFLALSIAALREREPLGAPPAPPRPRQNKTRSLEPRPRRAEPDQMERADLFAAPYTLPPMTDAPLMWKERYLGGPPLFFSPIVLVPALPFLGTGFVIMAFWLARALFMSAEEYERTLQTWTVILKFFYYVFLGIYTLGVAWRAGAAVARERQQQTLEPLLLLPIDRREILMAKLVGCLWRGWPWLILVACVILFGTLVGVFHPFSAVLLCLLPWPMFFFVATLGLALSIRMRTVLRANLVMVLTPLFLLGCLSIGIEACSFPLALERDPLGPFGNADRILVAGFEVITFGGFAYAFWSIALAWFQDRSINTEQG